MVNLQISPEAGVKPCLQCWKHFTALSCLLCASYRLSAFGILVIFSSYVDLPLACKIVNIYIYHEFS